MIEERRQQNPKHIRALKEGKAPMEYMVWEPLESVARVLKHGALKYGIRNWLKDKILASTYVAAFFRHIFLGWALGRDTDPDSGEPHLAHAAAMCLIIMDAKKHDTLIDDRTVCESIDQGNVAVATPSPDKTIGQYLHLGEEDDD